jgi:protoporphyrinogen oxidase
LGVLAAARRTLLGFPRKRFQAQYLLPGLRLIEFAGVNEMPVTDEDEKRVVALILRDVVATLGIPMEELVASKASSYRQYGDDYDRYVERVTEDVQQYFHDVYISTTWPTCLRHPNHPMWFHDGWWCCSGERIARLGELAPTSG